VRRVPFPGRAYVAKDALAYADRSSSLSSVDEREMAATFVITSEDVDRVGDVVVTKGIDLTNFCKNPIAFYNHQALILPIGVWECDGECTIKLGRGKATGTLHFSRRSREAEQIFALVAEGILRSTSIGFNPLEPPQPRADGGFRFPKVDLLEVSVVGIPCQPTATLVRQALSRNRLAGSAILAPIRKSLECLAEPTPARANGVTLMAKKKTPKAVSVDRLTGLLNLIPKELQDDLEECAAAELPRIRKDHPDWTAEQCHALALSLCGDKALTGSDGAGGGYTIPPGNRPRGAKAPPPPPKKPQQQGQGQGPPPPQQQAPPPPPQPQQQMPPDPMAGQQPGGMSGGERSAVLQALLQVVEGVGAAYDLMANGGEKPGTAGDMGGGIDQDMGEIPEEGDEFGDEDDEFGDVDLDGDEDDFGGEEQGGGEDDDEEELERYKRPQTQQRSATPRHAKKGRYYKAETMSRAKACMGGAADHLDELADEKTVYGKAHRTASGAHGKALRSLLKELDDEPEDAEPLEMKRLAARIAEREALDMDGLAKRLEAMDARTKASADAVYGLTGRMPESA
jgi:hypothetical protein